MKYAELVGQVMSFKVNSGEEVIAKIVEANEDYFMITNPVSVAPGPQGMGLIPSMYTAESGESVRINTVSIALLAKTGEDVEMRYIEATTGLTIPSKKKLIMG